MKNVMRTGVFLYLVLSAGCATLKTEYEDLKVGFEPGEYVWKVGYATEIPNQYALTEFIREGDDINNWRELFSIQTYNRKSWGPSPEDSLNGLKAIREKECPGATKWNVIEKNENSILYEWQAKPCRGWPDQHEIAKILYGTYNRFVVHYVAKVYQLPPDTRAKWIKRFAESKIILRWK